jgi:DNA-binding beta-propeller fold protein YncE
MQPTLLVAGALLALTSVAAAQQLIAIDSSRMLYQMDPATGARTQIGTVSSNASTTAGLAYDAATGTMYLTSTGNDSLYTLDLTTGNATLVGAYGSSSFVMHGLEYDPSTGTLYGVSSHDNGLYIIDKTTGLATLVGTSGLTSFSNLAYDSTNDVLYSTNSGADSFYIMDRATGATTLVGALLGPTNPNGLAYDSGTGTIYLVCNSTDTLYTVDRTTGAATVVGAYGSSNLLGLAYIPGGGSIVRQAHACGPTTITSVGNASIGGSVTTTLGAVTGLPFIGYGLVVVPLPFCTCTVGHEWSVAAFGGTSVFSIPSVPALIGLVVGIQGADFLGTGGCVSPQLTFTDTMVATIS